MSLTDVLAEVADHNRNLLKLYAAGQIKRRTLLASLKFLKDTQKPGDWRVIQLREEGAKEAAKRDPLLYCLPVELAIQRMLDQLPSVHFPYKEA